MKYNSNIWRDEYFRPFDGKAGAENSGKKVQKVYIISTDSQ